MSIIRHIQRLKYIDLMVKKKSTGNLDVFSKKNRLSKRGLLNVIQDMKALGFPIKYSRKLGSYYYYKDGEMVKCLFTLNDFNGSMYVNLTDEQVSELCYSPTSTFERCE